MALPYLETALSLKCGVISRSERMEALQFMPMPKLGPLNVKTYTEPREKLLRIPSTSSFGATEQAFLMSFVSIPLETASSILD